MLEKIAASTTFSSPLKQNASIEELTLLEKWNLPFCEKRLEKSNQFLEWSFFENNWNCQENRHPKFSIIANRFVESYVFKPKFLDFSGLALGLSEGPIVVQFR